MKLKKAAYEPNLLAEFFEEGLQSLGAICERTWHDRLQILAEGTPARLWNQDGSFLETEIHFTPPGESRPRDAAREVFPGCPLTFHLAETFQGKVLSLERVAVRFPEAARPPGIELAQKLWQNQFGGASHWQLATPFIGAWSFALMGLVRCEIRAIDQLWSLHRLAISLPEGEPDPLLAEHFSLAQGVSVPPAQIQWPPIDPERWKPFLGRSLESELAADVAAVRARQQNYLRRELDRIDAYFENYERELTARKKSNASRVRLAERLEAARTEHARRRQDQVHRHEIQVVAYLDALTIIAEPAWQATVQVGRPENNATHPALFLPRLRRWKPVQTLPTP